MPESKNLLDSLDVSFLVDAEMEHFIPTPLQPFEARHKQLELQIKRNVAKELESLEEGHTLIAAYDHELAERLAISDEVKAHLKDKEQVKAEFLNGKTFQDILGWSTSDLVAIYAIASRLKEERNYHDSAAIFKFLCFVQPLVSDFWLGAGDALAEENLTQEAILHYYGGLIASPFAFDLYLHLCKILCRDGSPEKAVAVLKEAFNLIEKQEMAGKVSEEMKTLRSKLEEVYQIISKKENSNE